jgi:hypothetical protein
MKAEERPLAEVRAEHFDRIATALDRLHDARGMESFLVAHWMKGGEGSATNLALMGWQAPKDMVENHFGWTRTYGERIPKGRTADVFLSNGRTLPVPCWSRSRLGLPPDYLEQRGGGEVPIMDGDYCRMLADSWTLADDGKAKPLMRVRLLNAWAREVSPRPIEGTGLESPAPVEVEIPF